MNAMYFCPVNSIGNQFKYNAREKIRRNCCKLKFSSNIINKITRVNQSKYLNVNLGLGSDDEHRV